MTDPRITFFATSSEALWAGNDLAARTPFSVCGANPACGVDSGGNPISPVPAKKFTHALPNSSAIGAGTAGSCSS